MQLKTVLNRVHRIKGFVYGHVRFVDQILEVDVRERKGSRPFCSGCGRRGPAYDRLSPRRFEFVPLWALSVFLVYAPRRVNCRDCGPRVEMLPWADGKRRKTRAMMVFLATWARRLSWKEVATVFRTSWDSVYRSVEWVVEYGLNHRDLEDVTAIGVDEIQFRKGHRYFTLVYQIDACRRRLLWIGEHRTIKTFLRFFKMMGRRRTAAIQFVCSDMWRAYVKVIAKKLPHALHILDRFHIVANVNKALDEVRAAEVRELKAKGYEPVLKRSRWLFLKRPENVTAKQGARLGQLMCHSLKTIRAYLHKESLQGVWEFTNVDYAGVYLDGWIRRVMRSRLEPLKKVARSIRKHRQLILNWFVAEKAFSAGIVEGLNTKVKLTTRKAYGFRTPKAAKTALYHVLGDLPQPKLTHTFC